MTAPRTTHTKRDVAHELLIMLDALVEMTKQRYKKWEFSTYRFLVIVKILITQRKPLTKSVSAVFINEIVVVRVQHPAWKFNWTRKTQLSNSQSQLCLINSNNLHAKRGFGFINNTLKSNIFLEDRRVPLEIRSIQFD